MKHVQPILLFLMVLGGLYMTACEKEPNQPDPVVPPALPQRYAAQAQCTTYNSNGSVLQIGAPYSFIVTAETSGRAGYNLHFVNLTGDNDTTVYASQIIGGSTFNIGQQPFKTSNGSNLTIDGSGSRSADSLNYSWRFYFSPTYKSHDCICRSAKL